MNNKNPFKNQLHANLFSQDALQNYLTQPVAILLEKTSTPANRIEAFLMLTPLISTRVDSEIRKIPSPVLQLLFETIKPIIKNYRRIGNIDNGEKMALYKFLKKTCSFATIACRTKFVADRDKNLPIQRMPRTSKSYSTYKDLRQIKGQEIHFHLLDKFNKYNGLEFLQSTLGCLTKGQIQGQSAFEMMMTIMRIFKTISPDVNKTMEILLLKISTILIEDGLIQRQQLSNPQTIGIVDQITLQNQQSNSSSLMVKGVNFLSLLAKCSASIKGQLGLTILENPKEIIFDDIKNISNEMYKPSNGNEGITKLCIRLLNVGGQLLNENIQVKQAGSEDNAIQKQLFQLAEILQIFANAFILPDQLLLDLFEFQEKIPLIQDDAENDPDNFHPKNFFQYAMLNAKLELIIPAITYLERKLWIEPIQQTQGQSSSSSSLSQLSQVAQCRVTPVIVDTSDIQLLNNLFSFWKYHLLQ
ncbi:MAG: hypothetical protein EZS28_012163 [Streblomastix strix]|uniref:Uncharacterized protein n=1 Tax=Streblomastix strix TaxID=222440 RepID=A0A5J4WBW7_9EUKA|nr:MAG: hypothetical protein EZS28_012163 [Streblomastix strix]